MLVLFTFISKLYFTLLTFLSKLFKCIFPLHLSILLLTFISNLHFTLLTLISKLCICIFPASLIHLPRLTFISKLHFILSLFIFKLFICIFPHRLSNHLFCYPEVDIETRYLSHQRHSSSPAFHTNIQTVISYSPGFISQLFSTFN